MPGAEPLIPSLLSSTPPPPPPPEQRQKPPLDPHLVATPKLERRLMRRAGVFPIGSRRRRAALQSSANIPFEQLPYQCFQEARKVLHADRVEKLRELDVQRARLERLLATPTPSTPAEQRQKKNRVASMRRRVEQLKVLADINDSLIKKRFEDGQGIYHKPPLNKFAPFYGGGDFSL
jgi:large subunit ribosomal protein L35